MLARLASNPRKQCVYQKTSRALAQRGACPPGAGGTWGTALAAWVGCTREAAANAAWPRPCSSPNHGHWVRTLESLIFGEIHANINEYVLHIKTSQFLNPGFLNNIPQYQGFSVIHIIRRWWGLARYKYLRGDQGDDGHSDEHREASGVCLGGPCKLSNTVRSKLS